MSRRLTTPQGVNTMKRLMRATSGVLRRGAESQAVVARPSLGRLLIVSNRLPVTANVQDDCLTISRSNGGLATGLAGHHARAGGLWIGWPGSRDAIADKHRGELAREFVARRLVPVPLRRDEVHGFYDQVSNSVLWPVFHDRLDRLPLHTPRWDIYESVNARYADTVADVYKPGDVIWVHDYQLLRLPALIRDRIPHARIGFFLHIPFPSPGIFESLTARDQLLAGLLGADLIGFHTAQYVDNFVATLERHPGMGVRFDGGVRVAKRQIRVGFFPMGVDVSNFAARATSPVVEVATKTLRASTQRLLVGVDRLDYSKGIPRRLLAFEELLTRYPEWRGKLRLIQIAVPSRCRVAAYRKFRREVEELVGRINGKFGTTMWTPVQYIHDSVSPEVLVALYRAADVMLVTPVRDGMNLVSKEFVASRVDEDGVLVLSEFAGAAEELVGALRINPYDTTAVALAIRTALVMTERERRFRMQRLRASVLERDVYWWADNFLSALTVS